MRAERRIEKLEKARLHPVENSLISPNVYLIKSGVAGQTYCINLGGELGDPYAKPGRAGVAIIVDGAPGEEIK